MTEHDRAVVALAQRAVDDSTLDALNDVRVYRNVLVATIAVLIAVLLAVPVGASRFETYFVTIVVESTGGAPVDENGDSARATQVSATRTPVTWRHVATIEFWGAVGGLVGMLVALRRLRTTAGPFGLYAAQAVLKVPAGALAALLLIILLQSGVVDQLQVAGTAQLAGFAALFGFAEQAVTRFVDRRASALLDRSDPVD